MKDDLTNKGAQDRSRVAAEEDWELQYMMKKHDVTEEEVVEAIDRAGNSRDKVEEYLEEKKRTADRRR